MRVLESIFLLSLLPSWVCSKAILGVDLGSAYMKVALVQRGAPLEIVTNLHSKRKTENMILFDSSTRFYGADANSLYARKTTKIPLALNIMLGRDEKHPSVTVLNERHYPIRPKYNETRSGLFLTVDGQDFTPEELVSMLLSHARDMTIAYGVENSGKTLSPKDLVLTVPSFATQHERKALLDAAALADLNVLSLIDETTAAALHYGMDKIMEEPKILIFYNLGASSLQVSVVRFLSYQHKDSKYAKVKTVGGLEVLGKAWDSTLGGLAIDHRIVEYLADEFNSQLEGVDVRDFPRPMAKLRVQANKVKHVLSANTEMPVYIESLHNDKPLSVTVTRAKLEELCADLLERATKPIAVALQRANVTLDEVDEFELLGGGMRVPKIREYLKQFLGESMELGMHINSDESMALGASFHGANISTAFKVRHVGMSDINPFPVRITLNELEGASESSDDEQWSKQAVIFKSGGKVGVKKTIAFTHDKDIHCTLDYEEDDALPQGTQLALERHDITGVVEFASEMKEKGLGSPKVSLQFELSNSGITRLVKAEAAVEEIYTVMEDQEVDDDETEAADATEDTTADATEDAAEDATKADATEDAAEDATKADATEDAAEDATKADATEDAAEDATKADATEDAAEDATKADATEESKSESEPAGEKHAEGADAKERASNKTEDGGEVEVEKEKPKKIIQVEKEKKKIHKRSLTVSSSYVGQVQPYSADMMSESKEKIDGLARKDKERQELEEAKNKVESYIYRIKNKLLDDGEIIGKVTTEEQREEVSKLSSDAEDWLYDDGYNADLTTMNEKYAEISMPMQKILFRVSELEALPAATTALKEKLEKIEKLMAKWETTHTHITEDERGDVLEKIEKVKSWISEKEDEQSKVASTEDPVFTSEECPLQTKSVESLVARLSRRPKPKPKVEEKNETKVDGNETQTGNETAEDSKGEEEESTSEESKQGEDDASTDDSKDIGDESKTESESDEL